MAAKNDKNHSIFLYEVIINPKMGRLNQIDGLFQRRGKFYLRVPYGRMRRETQRISRLGGKIVNIIPINTLDDLSIKDEKDVPWWVEITTTRPHCIYYFGPFDDFVEAYEHHGGYVEDLQEERAKGIMIHIKQCQPLVLTQELEEETIPMYNY